MRAHALLDPVPVSSWGELKGRLTPSPSRLCYVPLAKGWLVQGEMFHPAHEFMNDSRDFVLGFEVGRFYQAAREGCPVDGAFHQRNEGELLRLAAHLGLVRESWETQEGDWAFGRFVPKP